MTILEQIQGRKSRLLSYSYLKSVLAESWAENKDEISTASKAIDRSSDAQYTIPRIYGNYQVGLFCRGEKVKKVKAVIRAVGSPSTLYVKLLNAKTLATLETKQVSGVVDYFKTIETTFNSEYTSDSIVLGGTTCYYGFYIVYYQSGGDSSNYYEIAPALADGASELVYSSDGGTTYSRNGAKVRSSGETTLTIGGNAFKGSNYSYLNDATALHLTNFTIEFELRLAFNGNASSDMFILDKGYASNVDFWIRIPSGSRTLYVGYGDGVNKNEISYSISDDDWHHYCVTYDNSTKILTLYKDNVQVASNTFASGISNGSNGIIVGMKLDETSGAKVDLRLLRIYNSVLSASDRTNNFQKPLNPAGSPVVFIEPMKLTSGSAMQYGKTAAGATEEGKGYNTNTLTATKFTLSSPIRFNTIKLRLRVNVSPGYARCAVYKDSNGYPGALIANSATNTKSITSTTAYWETFTCAGTVYLKPGTYWLFTNVYGAVNAYVYEYYDAGATNQTYTINGSYGSTSPTTPDPFPSGATGQAKEFSIYADGYLFDYVNDLSGNNNHEYLGSNYNFVKKVIPLIYIGTSSGYVTAPEALALRTTRYYKIPFTVPTAIKAAIVGVRGWKRGSLGASMRISLYNASDVLQATAYIAGPDMTDDDKVWSAVLDSQVNLAAGSYYLKIESTSTTEGDDENNIYLDFESSGDESDYYYNGSSLSPVNMKTLIYVAGIITQDYLAATATTTAVNFYGNTRVGQTFYSSKRCPVANVALYIAKTGSPANLMVEIYEVNPATMKPSGAAISSLEVSASLIGSAAWVDMWISAPMEKASYYAVVAYVKGNAGDASNYYTAYKGASSIAGTFISSSDAGASWTIDNANDLAVKIRTPEEVYIEQYQPDLTSLKIDLAAQTFGVNYTMKSVDGTYVSIRVLVDGVEPGDCGNQYSGTDPLEVEIVPTTKTYTSPPTIAIYGYGLGIITLRKYARHHYFNKNPIEPKDFNVSEMILLDALLPPGSMIKFNDDPVQFIRNPSTATGDRIFDASGAPAEIGPIRKVEFVEGTADIEFLGW